MIPNDELNEILESSTLDELKELGKILSIDVNKFSKDKLIIEINYWSRYYSESSFEKMYSYYGTGIPYIEMLKKVCWSLDIKLSKKPTVKECENNMLNYLVSKLPDNIKLEIESNLSKEAMLAKLKNEGNWQEIKNISSNASSSIATSAAVKAGAIVASEIAAIQATKAAALSTAGSAYFKILFTQGFAGIAAQKAAQQLALQSAARAGILRTVLAPLAGPLGVGLILLSIGSFMFGESYSKIIPFTMMIAQLRVLRETEKEFF